MLQMIYRLRENHMYPFFIWGCLYTGSKCVVATMYSLFFLLHSVGWWMTYFIVWSTWLHTIWVTVTWWQVTINRTIEWPRAFFFSHLWLSVRLSVKVFFITSNHLIVSGCVCYCKMSQPNKRRRFLQSSEIAELFLDTDNGDATVSSDTSSVEGGPEGVPGVSHS